MRGFPEQDLLSAIVRNAKPSAAAVFSGASIEMAASYGWQDEQAQPNLSLIERVVVTGAPVTEKAEKSQLGVPIKDAQGLVVAVMYIEIVAPRRLKVRDLVILKSLGRQIEDSCESRK